MAERKADVASRMVMRRGLSEAEAAIYISLGASKFAQLVRDGRMPRPRLIDGRRVWDVDDIDAAFKAMPVEGEQLPIGENGGLDDNPWH
jgi:hypothetical protein